MSKEIWDELESLYLYCSLSNENEARVDAAIARGRALEKVAELAWKCIPPEAYFPKNNGSNVFRLREALAELDQLDSTTNTNSD